MEHIEKDKAAYGKLSEKRRLLGDALIELEREIVQKKQRAGILRKELVDLNLGHQPERNSQCQSPSGELYVFLQDVCVIMERLLSDQAYLQMKYCTQMSNHYYKVEKEVFEGYIGDLSRLALKDFLDFCSRLTFIKSDNGKYVFPSGSKRIYLVNRGIMDAVRFYYKI